jgi:hypothetical protein
MGTRFSSVNWNDGPSGGTPATSARGALRWENGILAVDDALDDLGDAVAALVALGGSTIPVGPTTGRPTPVPGQWYLDSDLGYPIIGNSAGTGWITAAGAAVTGAGAGNSPTNFTAVVQSDNSISFSWTAVAAATSYKLYESQSPTGVSGATALTGTSTTRSPATARTYTYWLTATVAGVEGAKSADAVVSLPFGSTPGGGSGTGTGETPAEILDINGVSAADGGWWNLGIGFHAGDAEGSAHVDITPTVLANGYTRSPYFIANATGSGVKMRVYADGGRTSANTQYPRCEFREYKNATTKAAWTGNSGSHIMSAKQKVISLPSFKQEICMAQVHNASDDTFQIRCEGASGSAIWSVKVNGSDVLPSLMTGYNWGDEVSWRVEMISGTLRVYFNDVLKITQSITGALATSGQYFKTGAYLQTNTAQGNSASSYGEIEIRDLVVTHSPAL